MLRYCLIFSFLLALAPRSHTAPASATNHWAYRPLQPVALPQPNDHTWARTPVDAFIDAELSAKGILAADEADQRTLARRVYFDLTGLPPSPQDMAAFLADSSPNAYERLVERLLASPRYGERWARHWIDVAHFAETHGHDQDRIRTNAWPYRDYLGASFNADKPYAQFIQEQIAGDILFPQDPSATVAMGFLAAGPWDESILRDIREDTIDRQIGRYLDRDDVVSTVMQTFSSATVQCARCHDHKFDPISQADYYSLQAVFAGVDRANRSFDRDPVIHRQRQQLLRLDQKIGRGAVELIDTPDAQRELAAWEASVTASERSWVPLAAQTFLSSGGATLTRQADGSILASGPRPDRDTYTISASAIGSAVTAIRLELLTDPSLPHQGPGRQDNGNLHLTEFQVLLFSTNGQPRALPIRRGYADFNQSGWTVAHALDGNEKTAWGIYPEVGRAHQAIFELKEPCRAGPGATLVIQIKQLHGEGHVIGRLRLSTTSEAKPSFLHLTADVAKLLAVPPEKRTEEQGRGLAIHYWKDKIARELSALPPPDLVYAAAAYFEPDASHKPAGKPRPVHLLRRGDINQPGAPAVPGALSCLTALSERFDLADTQDEASRRAALAQWLSAPDNPLTWRSIVNRVWHYHFGRGLVETPNDFGRMGAMPSHPALLDWLALWFRDEAHGSLKELHRLLVTSAVYRQSSQTRQRDLTTGREVTTPLDPDNRLLWRMNRSRLDAEQVRDAILQICDRLDLRSGGPSDQNFDLQPGGHVTPLVDYNKFEPNPAAGQRRGLYRFLFRTLPDPFMEALDCPAGDQLTPVRHASVTVQQALALWNNAFVARQSENLAQRLQQQGDTLETRTRLAFEWVLGRSPSATEAAELITYAREFGLANLSRVLLNSNEFMFLN